MVTITMPTWFTFVILRYIVVLIFCDILRVISKGVTYVFKSMYNRETTKSLMQVLKDSLPAKDVIFTASEMRNFLCNSKIINKEYANKKSTRSYIVTCLTKLASQGYLELVSQSTGADENHYKVISR